MPELPEVHTTATMLNRLIKEKRITDVWTDYGSPFHKGKENIKDSGYFARFKKAVIGSLIEGVHRKGKNVLIDIAGKRTIVVHMKMTGHLLVGTYTKKKNVWVVQDEGPLKEPINQFIHFVISFSDGTHLALSDLRKFAKVTLVEHSAQVNMKDLSTLGPDPTEKKFSFSDFQERLLKRPRGHIKAVLMDQTILAGIGNIYSDEMLWRADIHPHSIVKKIPLSHVKKLFTATKDILSKGVSLGGDSTSDYRNPYGKEGRFHYEHRAYQRTGTPCKKRGCPGVIQRISFRGRGAHFCNTHQKLYTEDVH